MSEPLDEIYDDITLARLNRAERPTFDAEAARGVRSKVAAGALLTGLILGFEAVFGPEREREVIEEIAADDLAGPDQRVMYIHVPGAPRASRAIIRW